MGLSKLNLQEQASLSRTCKTKLNNSQCCTFASASSVLSWPSQLTFPGDLRQIIFCIGDLCQLCLGCNPASPAQVPQLRGLHRRMFLLKLKPHFYVSGSSQCAPQTWSLTFLSTPACSRWAWPLVLWGAGWSCCWSASPGPTAERQASALLRPGHWHSPTHILPSQFPVHHDATRWRHSLKHSREPCRTATSLFVFVVGLSLSEQWETSEFYYARLQYAICAFMLKMCHMRDLLFIIK